MQPGLLRIVLPCLALILSGPLRASHEDKAAPEQTISWCQFDLPPVSIASGPQAGMGIVDGHTAFLIAKLPEYRHRYLQTNVARIQADIQAGQPLLCGGMQRNEERERYMLFSDAFYAFSPPRLILPRSKLEQLRPWTNAAGQVRLSEAIRQSGLNLGISGGRSYGRAIDEQLVALKGHPRILIRQTGSESGEGLVRMMMLGRLDMAIAFGSEERLYREVYRSPGGALVTAPIEGMPRLIPAYFVAPRNAWGRQLIQRINGLLRQHWDDPEFRRTAFFGQDSESRARTETLLREIDPRRKR